MKKILIFSAGFFIFCIAAAQAQYRYTVLHYFNDSTGGNPHGALTLSGGSLYGMTSSGGANHDGCIFSMDTNGASYSDLMDFNGINGSSAQGSLTFSGSTMFGMTSLGGAMGKGCIFKLLTNGTGYVDLVDFDSANGANPQDNLTLKGDTLYGMTLNGGAHGCGLIFSIDTNGGNYLDLLDFDTANGAYPYGSLTLAGNILYGMTSQGGDSLYGCIFSVHIDGSGYQILHDFNFRRVLLPFNPVGSLLLSKNMLYGMTKENYANQPWNNNGVIFKIDTNGNTFTQMGFSNSLPNGSFILKDSVLYSMTPENAGNNLYPHVEAGRVFSIDTNGLDYTVLHNFLRYGLNGDGGCKSLTLGSTGFYGMTTNGADTSSRTYAGSGVIFKLVDTGIYYPQVTLNIFNVSCNGGNNGSALANVSGGYPPYTYLWQPSGNTTNSVTALNAGTYTLSVTGNNDSTATSVVTITQPVLLNPDFYIIANVSCNGGSNAIDSVSANGGTPPFTYLWSDANSQTTATATGLSAGGYSIIVSDSCGNSSTIGTIITQPVALNPDAYSIANVSCNGGSNGIVSVSPDGGTSPYTYLWSDANTQTTESATGLSAGTYTVLVNDSCGASASASVSLSQPPVLTVSASILANVSCNGGSNAADSVFAEGGTSPYTYSWSDANSQTTATASGLNAASFTVIVTDSCGSSLTATVVNTEPAVLSVSAVVLENVSCYGGANGVSKAEPTGGTKPFTYSWSPAGGINQTGIGLSAGTYTVIVSDSCSATATTETIITQPAALQVEVDTLVTDSAGCASKAWAVVSGGTSPYTYSWTGGFTTDSILDLCSGHYCCEIKDARGCTNEFCVNLVVVSGIDELAENTNRVKIYPNPNNGSFILSLSNGNEKCTVEIYNMLGEKVLMETLRSTQGDSPIAIGLINLTEQPDGVYLYRVIEEDGSLVGDGKIIIQK